MGEPFDVVRRGYDRIGSGYRDWSAAGAVRRYWLAVLLADLAPGSLVVDLGCGPGEPVTRTLAELHRVIGVDGSRVQLDLARSAAPTARLVQADMTRFALRPGSVDAVASFYALGHVPAERHAPLIAAVARWLRPGGLFLTSAPVGAGDGIEPEEVAPVEDAGEEERPRIVAKGLAEPSAPTRLAYSSPSVDGEAAPVVSTDTIEDEFANVSRNDPCPCGSGRKYKRCHGDPARRRA